MTDAPNRPPLWRVIEDCDTFMPVHGLLRRRLIAELIRAFADWLVPEETDITSYLPPGGYSTSSIKQKQRQSLRALLITEADRAEKGE